ncbi:hypothetical protein KC352_g23115 [Hortaea werneckii]|nr:hypothetical protein KC352_g23115 [Hortaea werneckii]KAI7600319.1 hypothetical protein KC346_g13323 [Hortaea werneckii]KAI7669347.1 hypothetical protein KC322_g16306 [Hortaea werneckii]
MSAQAAPNGIILFHYPQSPYGRRVRWYLALRGIAYAECIQPWILPRPDMEALGVHYRRSPVMAIGRHIYVDSRMILRKLEELFPPSAEHPALSTKETEGMAALMNKFVVDAGVFSKAVGIMRPDRAALQDPAFVKDPLRRWEKLGGIYIRANSGGSRSYEGVWAFDWIISDLEPPPEYFSEAIYPRVYDWRKRFKESVRAARTQAPTPVALKGQEAVQATLTADSSDQTPVVDLGDPLGLKEGTLVELYPTDGGGAGPFKDQGRLWRLDKNEVAISVQAPSGEEVRIHAPRWHFRVKKASATSML